LRGAATETVFVQNIDYDAKGQRTLIEYGNGVRTTYTYDPETFLLVRLLTTRISDSARLQDLQYTYDPVGNITEIRDDAQQTIFFNNAVVSPNTRYEYDALYRLMRAEGREHAGQLADTQRDHQDVPVMPLPHPNNGQAMRNYTERYEYDGVGNILAMIHAATNGNWTRRYQYAEDSNRLLAISRPGDGNGEFSAAYTYDTHGNMTTMPHLPLMQWDDRDRLKATSRQVVIEGTPETTYYVYDGGGQRVRKVTERQAAVGETPIRKNERIYLGGFEIYREYGGDVGTVTLERETLDVMDDRQRIALVETKTIDTENNSETPLLAPIIRYQFGNHLGSVSLEVDATGAVISYEEYHPYGTTAYRSGRSAAEVSLKRYRYTGMERDEETGLGYHGARYYAAWLGRWTAADPSLLAGGINLQMYAHDNPLTYKDSNGKTPEAVVVDEKNRTITFKTTIYVKATAQQDIDLATKGAEYFNVQSGKFKYELPTEQGKESYKINFDISVKKVSNKEFSGKKSEFKESRVSAQVVFEIQSKAKFRQEYISNRGEIPKQTVRGYAHNSIIQIHEDSANNSTESAHEIGHFLEMNHPIEENEINLLTKMIYGDELMFPVVAPDDELSKKRLSVTNLLQVSGNLGSLSIPDKFDNAFNNQTGKFIEINSRAEKREERRRARAEKREERREERRKDRSVIIVDENPIIIQGSRPQIK
jgi:RHS repeat-associated protein